HEGRHLGTAAELVDEGGVEPGLIDLEVRVDEQAVTIEALDVIALEGRAVAPDVDVIFLHGGHQHCAGDRTADGCRVEVGDAGGGVQPAGKGDADLLTEGQGFEDYGHSDADLNG